MGSLDCSDLIHEVLNDEKGVEDITVLKTKYYLQSTIVVYYL